MRQFKNLRWARPPRSSPRREARNLHHQEVSHPELPTGCSPAHVRLSKVRSACRYSCVFQGEGLPLLGRIRRGSLSCPGDRSPAGLGPTRRQGTSLMRFSVSPNRWHRVAAQSVELRSRCASDADGKKLAGAVRTSSPPSRHGLAFFPRSPGGLGTILPNRRCEISAGLASGGGLFGLRAFRALVVLLVLVATGSARATEWPGTADVPLPPYTPALDILAFGRAKATLFLVGRMARAYPNTVGQIHTAGHSSAHIATPTRSRSIA